MSSRKSAEELAAQAEASARKIAELEARLERQDQEYKTERRQLDAEMTTLRQQVAAPPMGGMGMMGAGFPGMGIPGMGFPGAPAMPFAGAMPSPGGTAAPGAGGVDPMQQMQMQMQMMTLMSQMAQSNPQMAQMMQPMMAQMMMAAANPGAAATQMPMPQMPQAMPMQMPPAMAPMSTGGGGSGAAGSVSERASSAAGKRTTDSDKTSESTMAGGGSTVAQLKSLQAEKERLAARSLSASNRASSAAKSASVKASAVARQETSVDLCIMIDCTGSMGSWIEIAKTKAKEVIKQAQERFKVDIRVSFVGYRDFSDQLRFQTKDFVGEDDIDSVVSLISNCAASGGGDGPEDVAGGLEKAVDMAWSSRIRLLVHIADAPAHGEDYNDGGDSPDHLRQAMAGPDPADLVRRLAEKKVNYFFFKINSSTDKMVEKLRAAHVNSRREFKVHDLGSDVALFAETLMSTISSSVSAARSAAPVAPEDSLMSARERLGSSSRSASSSRSESSRHGSVVASSSKLDY